ncbi:hypothetical protein KBC89_02025 [Candidatus Woesebacteria bacterium]|nr:hypothetical protein [Candidatus Woesebacteria bacterium]
MTDTTMATIFSAYKQPLLLVLPVETDQQNSVAGILTQYSPYTNALLHPAILWINLEMESIGIDTARQITTELSFSPLNNQIRVFVLLGFEGATTEAQNALLKLLESQTAQTQFWLVTHTMSKVLPTIQSRCSIIKVPFEHLILKEQNSTEVAKLFSEISQASIAECISLASKYPDRTDALNITTSLLRWLTQQTNFVPSSAQLRCLQLAFSRLEQNANVKLALESAFFGLSGAKDHF